MSLGLTETDNNPVLNTPYNVLLLCKLWGVKVHASRRHDLSTASWRSGWKGNKAENLPKGSTKCVLTWENVIFPFMSCSLGPSGHSFWKALVRKPLEDIKNITITSFLMASSYVPWQGQTNCCPKGQEYVSQDQVCPHEAHILQKRNTFFSGIYYAHSFHFILISDF